MKLTDNLNVVDVIPLISPETLKEDLPVSETASETVITARKAIQQILAGKDQRLLVIVGPCSIHDADAAHDYAERLKKLADQVAETILIVMRVYFEKPRTTVGWKGLINDPELNGSHKINEGIKLARKILLATNNMGLPCATETLDPITPQYLADLISWSAIGARTTESQTHRELASGLSMPVGFKNGTNGGLNVALNAMASAQQPHHFLGISQQGASSVIQTSGNNFVHLVLRGGSNGPNFDAVSIHNAADELASAGLPKAIMIDCNHANSGKDPERQELVLRNLILQKT
jgi:3-deoxy-7-phosphoheptulonate synthase